MPSDRTFYYDKEGRIPIVLSTLYGSVCISSETLSLLSAKEIRNVLNWFKKNGKTILAAMAWEEGGFDSQFVSPEDLLEISKNKYVDAQTRQYAEDEMHGIHHYAWWRDSPPKPKVVDNSGCIYLIKCSEWYKIGKTKNVDRRMKTFGEALPFKQEVIHVIRSDDYSALELELHSRFADKRMNGEWFALLPEDVEYIKGIK